MSKGLLDPKVDFVFKNIFGSPNHPEILISFLNATLKPKRKIVNVDIKKTDIEKQYIEDKYSRLDVKATTSNDEIINIEIQLKNENNMIKRSLYYLSKMYEEQLNEKDLIVAGYFTDCEQAYDYFSVCQKYGDAHMQIKLHTIEAAHPIYPPYLFKETEGIIHDPVAWRKELPIPNNNLKKLSKEELRFFKLISAYNLPYNLKTFCEEKNFELEFAEITIKKLIMQNIIYGFDLQINAKELGLAHCEHICIPHPTSQTFNAITENPNLELANLMSDGSVLLIIYGRDKEDVEKQLLEFAPLEEIQRYHVQNWVMKPHNVLPQWVVDIKVD